MSDVGEPCDPVCQERGIPPHLHQAGRAVDPYFEPGELLYRRHKSPEPDLTDVINFKKMSVNRRKYCEGPEDVLWNDQQGGKYPDRAVFALPVAALSLQVNHPDQKNHPYSFRLKPIHKPNQCNYPHTEITAFRVMANGSEEEIADIKPPSVKLQMRTELAEHLELHYRVGS